MSIEESAIPVKVFEAKVEDECGGVWDKAIVAVFFFTGDSRTTAETESFNGNYLLERYAYGISYKLSFYYDQDKKDRGKRSKPLLHEVYIEPQIIYETDSNGNLVRDERGNKIPTSELTKGRYVLSDTFYVDETNEDVKAVLESDLEFESKVLRAIKMDIAIRYATK